MSRLTAILTRLTPFLTHPAIFYSLLAAFFVLYRPLSPALPWWQDAVVIVLLAVLCGLAYHSNPVGLDVPIIMFSGFVYSADYPYFAAPPILIALFFYLITLWQDVRRKTPPTRLELAADYTAHLANFAITLLWLTLARAHPHYTELATYLIIMTLFSGAALLHRTATALRQP
mgnify:FL=1